LLFDVDYLDIDTSCGQQYCLGWFLRRRTSIAGAKDEGLGICDLPGGPPNCQNHSNHCFYTKTLYFMIPKGDSIVAATRSIASRANSGLCTLTFGISQLASQRKWEMPDVFDGLRADRLRRQQSPGLILSSHEMAGLRYLSLFRQAAMI
jgi:hypothetical protein